MNRVFPFVALIACGCGFDSTQPQTDPTACTSTSSDPSSGCARIAAQIRYADGRPAFAFILLDRLADTSRYHVIAPATDTSGHTVVEVRRRYPASADTAAVNLLVVTPQASTLGTFFCAIVTARLRFSPPGAVPDTLRTAWVLTSNVARYDQCPGSVDIVAPGA